MNYKIVLEKDVIKALKRLSATDKERLQKSIDSLSKDPSQGELLKGQWQGLWRLRVGQYRIIYAIKDDQLIVMILRIGNRKDIYR